MKEITISEKNFKRFAKRYQKIHNTGLMDAQEKLSKILGCSNYHELSNHLGEEYSYQHYNNFLNNIKNIVYLLEYDEKDLIFFQFNDIDINLIHHKFYETKEYYLDEQFRTYIPLNLHTLNTKRNKNDYVYKDLFNIINKNLKDKNIQQWKLGFINFLKSLPQLTYIDGIFLLAFNKKYLKSGRIIITLTTNSRFDEGYYYSSYDIDYFSKEISNLKEKYIDECEVESDLEKFNKACGWLKENQEDLEKEQDFLEEQNNLYKEISYI